MHALLRLCFIPFALLAAATHASEPASGTYTATRACDAYASFAKGTNPGSVRTAAGAEYDVIEVNKREGYEWLRVTVDSAMPPQRWVPRECGIATVQVKPGTGGTGGTGGGNAQCRVPDKHESWVLAATWQPGFCEHKPGADDESECKAMEKEELAIDHLTLHGLWPNRKACGTDYGNCTLPSGESRPFQISEDTVSAISPWMPSFYFGTAFGQYEWKKHGTCQTLDTDAYFTLAVQALKMLNDSDIGLAVRSNIGKRLAVDAFFDQVDKSYGKAVASNIQLVCTDGGFLQEMRFNLPRQIRLDGGPAQLIAGAGFADRAPRCGESLYIERTGPD
jgi:ribonuclease T2